MCSLSMLRETGGIRKAKLNETGCATIVLRFLGNQDINAELLDGIK